MSLNETDKSQARGAVYQITIQGAVHAHWSDWFDGFEFATYQGTDGKPVTTMKGMIADQSELRGLLTHLWDLNAVVIALNQTGQDCLNLKNSQNGEKIR